MGFLADIAGSSLSKSQVISAQIKQEEKCPFETFFLAPGVVVVQVHVHQVDAHYYHAQHQRIILT